MTSRPGVAYRPIVVASGPDEPPALLARAPSAVCALKCAASIKYSAATSSSSAPIFTSLSPLCARSASFEKMRSSVSRAV